MSFPVPAAVCGRDISLEVSPSGNSLDLSVAVPDGADDTSDAAVKWEDISGWRFQGQVAAAECDWMLDEFDEGHKFITLTLAKRRGEPSSLWWSGVFEGDSAWGA